MSDDPEDFETRTPLPQSLAALVERLHSSCSERHSAERLELERFRVGLVGEDGKNGRLGALTVSVTGIRKSLIAIAMVAFGSCGGWIWRLDDAGETRGVERNRLDQVERAAIEMHNTIEQLRAEVWRIRYQQPVAPAGVTP